LKILDILMASAGLLSPCSATGAEIVSFYGYARRGMAGGSRHVPKKSFKGMRPALQKVSEERTCKGGF
jgi:hypothetical protein